MLKSQEGKEYEIFRYGIKLSKDKKAFEQNTKTFHANLDESLSDLNKRLEETDSNSIMMRIKTNHGIEWVTFRRTEDNSEWTLLNGRRFPVDAKNERQPKVTPGEYLSRLSKGVYTHTFIRKAWDWMRGNKTKLEGYDVIYSDEVKLADASSPPLPETQTNEI